MKKVMIILILVGMYLSCSINQLDDVNVTDNIGTLDNGDIINTDIIDNQDLPIDSAITNLPEDILEPVDSDCITNGGRAGDSGLKVWCWKDIPVPSFSGEDGTPYLYSNQIKLSNVCYEKQITNVGDKLRFNLNPINPPVESWCREDYNMRAEIRTSPWNIKHKSGTEEWFGWNYKFGDDYIIDQNNDWLFFQVHNGITGQSPHVKLFIIHKDSHGHDAGEIFIANNGNHPDYVATGITPQAGDDFDIVVHAIWGRSNGLLQVWIDGNIVYDKQVPTIYSEQPWGGNAKWGIYHHNWRDGADMQKSLDQGISHLETFMGPLRVITRYPGDADYGKNSYELVKPR